MTHFDAWALPAAVDPVEAVIADEGGRGTFEVRYPNLGVGGMRALTDVLVRRGARPGAGVRERIRALGAVGARFLDPEDPLRTEALRLLPASAGLSPPMARAVLDGMAADWTEARLLELVERELGDPDRLGRWRGPPGARTLMVPPRLCVQLAAGSVPGVGVSALIRSALVGAPTLLKPGLGDIVLPVLFARALRTEAPELADRVAVLYWPGGSDALERTALAAAEVVVAYGSDQAVAALRALAPPTTRFLAHHHRSGIGVVGQGALATREAAAAVAGEVARAAALFDQRGCVSPRVVHVEDAPADAEDAPEDAPVDAGAFADLLAGALDRLETELPSGELDARERGALQQLRGTAELLVGLDPDAFVRHGGARPWTVVHDPGARVEPAAGGRVLVVRPFRTLDTLVETLRPEGPHLQTVGVAGLGDRLDALAADLGALGASRVTPFRAVPFPPPWWHHDGRDPLRDLVRWVDRGAEER